MEKRKCPNFQVSTRHPPPLLKGRPLASIRHLWRSRLPRFSFLGFSFVHDSPGVPDKLNEGLLGLWFFIVQQGKFFTGPEIYTYTTACMQAPAQGCVGL